MGRNAIEALGGAGRKDAVAFDPEKLSIVLDREHCLFDERALLEPDAELIASIDEQGVLEPVIVRRNGEIDGVVNVEVVCGRQRVRAVRVINKRRIGTARPQMQVYAMVVRGTDAEMVMMMAAENEVRRADTPMVRAAKMGRAAKFGATEQQIAVSFGVPRSAVKSMLTLLDLSPVVQREVDSGALPLSTALEFAKAPRETQPAKLAALKAVGKLKGAAAKDNAKRVSRGLTPRVHSGTKMRSRAFIEAFVLELEKGPGGTHASARLDVANLLRFILGSKWEDLPSWTVECAARAQKASS